MVLSSSEGMNAIFGCYKIAKVQDGTEIIVWRQEQGYDPKEWKNYCKRGLKSQTNEYGVIGKFFRGLTWMN